jgi:carbon monoxide dehydrogenase subunit G
MHFEGEFRVPGTPDQVMGRFTDVHRMARCMPGAVIEGRGDDGSYLGAMVVAFGPKKINFRGRVSHDFDAVAHAGTLSGRGAADMRAARIGVKVSYTVRAVAGAVPATSVVALVSDAELTGVLAEFARTGGIPVANALMAGFAKRMAEEFADETSASDTAADAVPATPTTETVTPLAAHGLLWDIIKAKLLQLARRLGLAARSPKTEGKRL